MKIKSYLIATLMIVALSAPNALAQHPAGHGPKMADTPYDLHYIDMMIEHQQMGIDMAKMAQTFARTTIDKQQKERAQLSKWKTAWGGRAQAAKPEHKGHTMKP